RLLAAGALGRPLVAHCQTTWYRDTAYYEVPWRGRWATEGGGPAMGHGIHQMDLLLDLLGPWSEVRAMAGRLVHDVETEDVSTALVRFADGALATVVNSVLSPDEVSRIRIDCERATVELTHLYGHGNANWRITPAPGVPADEAAAWQDFGPDVPSSHLAQLRELVAAMRVGERPRSSGADGRTSLELITALYKAAFTGTTVRAGDIGPGDPYYTALHGGAPGWAPVEREEVSA
ncbi:Gfo/Idh/MocA family protein, partial [Streptomyces sp. NPDC059627]